MLKSTDLRLGNLIIVSCPHEKLIYFKEKTIEKCNIHHLEDIYNENINWMYEPIPITEEWLIKFGFQEIKPLENDIHKWSTYFKKGVYIDLPYFEFNIEEISKTVEYVHDLQNLYFSLIGEELEL